MERRLFAALAATSRGGWLLAAKACHGNPYDGHTLKETMEQVDRVIGRIPEHVYVDMGYRGHDYQGEAEIHMDKRRRGRIAKSVWRWMKRRAGVEPSIAHLKAHKRMDRNRLKGTVGDAINALLSAAGMNLSKIIKALRALCPYSRYCTPGSSERARPIPLPDPLEGLRHNGFFQNRLNRIDLDIVTS